MLYHLEPDQSISGGTFYSQQQLDVELVNSLLMQIYQFLEHKYHSCTVNHQAIKPHMYSVSPFDILNHITNLNITSKQLTIENIEQLLTILVYEQKASKIIKTDKMYFF